MTRHEQTTWLRRLDEEVELGASVGVYPIEALHGLSPEQLPPLPADPLGKGRHVSWTIIGAAPGFVEPKTGEWHPVDADWIDHQVAEYARFCGDFGYHAPIRREHVPEGIRWGDVVVLAAWTDPRDGRAKLLAALAWADVLDAENRLAAGQLRYVSGGWRKITDERGVLYEEVVGEVSFVGAPHLKHAAAGGHILNSEASEATTTPTGETMDVEARMNKLEESMTALQENIGTLTKLMEGKKPEPKEEPKEEPTVAAGEQVDPKQIDPKQELGEKPTNALILQLSERTTELEAQLARANFEKGFKVGMVIELSEEDKEAWFNLAKGNPKAFKVLSAKLKEPAKAPESPKDPVDFWGTQLGEGDAPAPKGPGGKPKTVTVAELREKSKAAGKGLEGEAADRAVKTAYLQLYKRAVAEEIEVLA